MDKELFELCLGFPVFFLVALLFFYIQFKDKIELLFPNPKARLEKYIYSKNLCDSQSELVKLINKEIENENFLNVTGLQMNARNVELLNLYNKLGGKLAWRDFLRIKDYINNFSEPKKLISNKIKIVVYWGYLFWGLPFLASGIYALMFLPFFCHYSFSVDSTWNKLSLAIIVLAISEVFFLRVKMKYDAIKKYDAIILSVTL